SPSATIRRASANDRCSPASLAPTRCSRTPRCTARRESPDACAVCRALHTQARRGVIALERAHGLLICQLAGPLVCRLDTLAQRRFGARSWRENLALGPACRASHRSRRLEALSDSPRNRG